MSINGVFFDLYGTLLMYGDMSAAWSDWLSVFHSCLSKRGLAMSQGSFALHCDHFFGKDEPPEKDDRLTVLESRIQALCLDLGLIVNVGEIKHIATTIANTWQNHISLDPDCHTVLQALWPHKTLGIISNFDHPPHLFTLISELGLKEFFDIVVVSGDVGVKKPDPKIFHIALARTGLQPEEVIYVGDTEEDVVGARTAGIIPISIRRDPADNYGIAFDFTANGETLHSAYRAPNMTGVRTITSLPELIKVIS